MTIAIPTSNLEAKRLLTDYYYKARDILPEGLASHLEHCALNESTTPIAIADAGEALYAYMSDLDEEGLNVCRALISYAAGWGWMGLGVDDRGMNIVRAVARELGEVSPFGAAPDVASDPVPQDRFKPAAPAPLPVDPAGTPAILADPGVGGDPLNPST